MGGLFIYPGTPPPNLGADWSLDVSAVVSGMGNYITKAEFNEILEKREVSALKQVPVRRITSDSFVCDELAGTSGGLVEPSVPSRSPTGSDACQVLPEVAPHSSEVTLDSLPRFTFSPSSEIWFDSSTGEPVPRYMLSQVKAEMGITVESEATADANINSHGQHISSGEPVSGNPSADVSISASKKSD